MCRRKDLYCCCLFCFGLGILFGKCVESWIFCRGGSHPPATPAFRKHRVGCYTASLTGDTIAYIISSMWYT